MSRLIWTREMQQMVEENYASMDTTELAALISKKSCRKVHRLQVVGKASQLGIKKDEAAMLASKHAGYAAFRKQQQQKAAMGVGRKIGTGTVFVQGNVTTHLSGMDE